MTPSNASLARAVLVPLDNLDLYWPPILAALTSLTIPDAPVQVAALATVAVETGIFAPIPEKGVPSWFENHYGYTSKAGPILGNVNPGDGMKYAGRGFIQITGRFNYTHFGKVIPIPDLVDHPELALDPEIAAKVLARYFVERGVPALARRGEWVAVRKAVNGGSNGLQRFLQLVKNLEGVFTPKEA